MQLKFSNLAELDLEILTFRGVLNFGSERSEAYLKAVFETLNLICQFPEIGYLPYPKDFPNLRRMQTGSHMIFYYPHLDYIWVSRMPHQKMDFDDMIFIDNTQ